MRGPSKRFNQSTTKGRRLRQPRSGDLAGGRTALAPASAARGRPTVASQPRHLNENCTERAGNRAFRPAQFLPPASEAQLRGLVRWTSGNVVREGDHEDEDDEHDPDHGHSLVDLAGQRAAADSLDEREEDVAAIEG